MEKLNLLFTKDSVFYQFMRSKSVKEESSFTPDDEVLQDSVLEKLNAVLEKKTDRITVISALNHFTMVPEGFSQHDAGYDLIALNAGIDADKEELMLAVNKKYGVQFYYTFPKDLYHRLKGKNIPVNFNFSGEKFLSSISPRSGKEIHINLHHNQCEFFALNGKKIKLYNNLDMTSEVDFLYFIMFSLSKIDFGINETRFYVYGETSENETFISELQKFVKQLKIVYDNLPKKKFLINN
ncbi:DUF3822 family protein [Chryseobacterium sp. MFBS3-17]|uniref:DUF3822 family protein n=1 Tax=Chryseobacterium sp. MFBS3-17 TaxID=2886689 RepID=UPI001D0EF0BB|nr:DUF3822 family protein [Chryseobacterium sp. MFBS3-17]MCC2591092.1 DUF3822 family protein [Chryseobacterium sp. MFBS3-17]